ncbi:MAG: hypothetical protein NW206_05095 [Hyphomonadaceae bacterium]|nr:hypothetical protein [Hyphomonadaceae bacterium]
MAGLADVMGDVAGAGAAFAGLVLVFMGATTTAYEGFDQPAQKLVRKKFLQRIWLSFVGIAFGMLATALALLAGAGAPECVAWGAIISLALAASSVLFAALQTALDIR